MPDPIEEKPLKFSWLIDHLKRRIVTLELKLFQTALNRFITTPGTVMDLPTGEGHRLTLLQERRLNVYAVNSSLSQEEQKKWNTMGVTFQTMDPKKLLFPDNAFDYITSSGLLEHSNENDRKRVFKELIRVTRNMLFIAVRTADFSVTTALRGALSPETLPSSLISRKDLRTLFSQEPLLQLLDLRSAGGLESGLIIAVLQKQNPKA